MAEEPQPSDRVELRATWIGLEEVQIIFANQAIAQVDDQGDAILTFGQATPPVVLAGTPEEQRQQLAAVPFVQVRPVARISLSTERIRQVITILQQTLTNQEKVKRELKKGEK